MSEEWRDGFLFIGNELSLDFLNTSMLLESGADPVEKLPDTGALIAWMAAAGLISSAGAARLKRQPQPGLGPLLEFRNQWRRAMFRIEAGGAPMAGFVAQVNSLLAEYPYVDAIIGDGGELSRVKRFDPQTVLDVFGPLADSVAKVLTLADKQRLRKCDNCILHFHDTSKKGVRRWCSMNLCGNRSKVAAYARRKSQEC